MLPAVHIVMMLEWFVNVSLNYSNLSFIYTLIVPCTNGDIRLGDDAVLRGRVEVCINGTWSTICDHLGNWSVCN